MQIGDKVKVIGYSERLGRTGIITNIFEGNDPSNDELILLFPDEVERKFFADEVETDNPATDIKDAVRKHRRSFEEQLRKYLLKLEQNGEHNTSQLVLKHLETELHNQMVEYSK